MKIFWFFAIMFVLFLAFVQPCLAQTINPKAVTSSTVKITKSGTLTPSGNIQSASLMLYIAQDGGQTPVITPNDWEYINDSSGNRMVLIHFRDLKQPQTYSLVQTVETNAQRLSSDVSIDSDSAYSQETSGAQITTNISATAYPYGRTLEGVSELTSWVHGYVTYDKSLFAQSKPSDWVLENRRGVCVEFSNLLAALLRSKNIPTRYANGYAYSPTDNSLIGHAWVEVLAGGRWVGFDPTWLEGGFLDATHVITSESNDGVEKETLSYLGTGDLNWKKNTDQVELVDYKTENTTQIILDAPANIPLVGGGYIRADLSASGCMLNSIATSSCLDENGNDVLSIKDGNVDVWFCGSASVYWAFTNSLSQGYSYTCPVLAFDQSSDNAEKTISISGTVSGSEPYISGPDSTGVNQPFVLTASQGSIFFSKDFGRSQSEQWQLSISRPGIYKFYAYANGKLAQKTVSVTTEREFDLSIVAPSSVNQSQTFLIKATITNIVSKAKAASIRVVFGNQTLDTSFSFDIGQTKDFEFNLTAYDSGTHKYSVSVSSDSLTGYSGNINVIPAPEKPTGIIEAIIEALQGFIAWIKSLLGL